jgi:glucosamine--fructose-6-phosphate aminotransferase (isomerizing)
VTLYNSTLHFKTTLVIAISQSGQSPDLVQFATAARSSGARIISMTNDSHSPLAELAHLHLALQAGPELAVAATKTYSAQLLTCYLFVAAWANFPTSETQIIDQAEKLVTDLHLVDEAVNSCDRDEEIVVLGRGFAYPNAREMALKIQETSKVSVQGLSTADYLHGPISALTRRTQVFIVAPSHMPVGSIDEAVTKIRPQVDRIFWVGNAGSPQGTDSVVGGANCDDEISTSIVDAIAVQRFALEFATKSGFDPDAPAGLSKVTLTL